MVPQPNLAHPTSVVSVILPQAFVNRVRRVQPSPETQQSSSRGGAVVAAFGLNGTVDGDDMCYMEAFALQNNIAHNEGFYEVWEYNPHGDPIFRAVLDLRSRSDLSAHINRRFSRSWNERWDPGNNM